jgi:hypothetical protein
MFQAVVDHLPPVMRTHLMSFQRGDDLRNLLLRPALRQRRTLFGGARPFNNSSGMS